MSWSRADLASRDISGRLMTPIQPSVDDSRPRRRPTDRLGRRVSFHTHTVHRALLAPSCRKFTALSAADPILK